MFSHQLLSNVEHTLNILEFCVLVDFLNLTKKMAQDELAAFIDEVMNIHNINTFVLSASIVNVALVADIPNFFRKN